MPDPPREPATQPRPALDPVWMTFVDPEVERAYRAHELEVDIAPTFFAVAVAATLTFVSFGAIDWWLVPEAWPVAKWWRYGAVVPLFTSFAIAARTRHLAAVFAWIRPLAIVAPSVLFLAIGAHAEQPGSALYQLFPLFFMLLIPQLVRADAREAAWTGAAVLPAAALSMWKASTPPAIVVFIGVTLATAGAWGAIAARRRCSSGRLAYFQAQLIAQQLEELAEARARSEELLLNVLPRAIAERLKHNQGAIADAFDDVVVLFADIVGYTAYSAEVEPEELVKRLNDVFSCFDRLVAERGLEKIKTIGDCYMVAGGLPEPHDDAPGAMTDLALAMGVELERLNEGRKVPLALRIGIHVGPVVAGVIGERKFIYDLWGDTVNVASRMESHGEPGRIQVSDAMAKRIEGRHSLVSRGTIPIKNRGAMEVWFVADEADEADLGRT